MKNKTLVLAGTFALLASTTLSSYAAPASAEETFEGFSNRFYIGAGFGPSNVELKADARNEEGIDFNFEGTDDGDISTSIMLGARVGKHVSVEAGMLDLGSVDQNFTFNDPHNGNTGSGLLSVAPSGYYGAILLTHSVGPVQLYGRAGAFMWDYDMDIRFDIEDGDEIHSQKSELSRDGTSMIYGGGVRWRFAKSWNLGVDANFTDVDGDKLSTVGLSILYDLGTELYGDN